MTTIWNIQEPCMRLNRFLIFFIFSFRLCAQTTLSGNIGGMTFEKEGNPYIISETVTIQKGKTTTVSSGCIFHFKPYTGIEVNGTLIVAGYHDNPVIFTSINDMNFNNNADQPAKPFDWNGISINWSATNVRLSNFMLAYSVFGVKTLPENILIKNGIFLQNGQYNFTINNSIQQVPDNLPYSYTAGADTTKHPDRRLKTLSLISGGTGIICGAVSGIFWNNYRKAWHDAEYATYTIEIADANKREEKHLKDAGILTGISITFLSSAVVLYIIDYRQHKNKRAVLAPLFGPEYTGLVFHYTF